jgi:hypothetical protein
MDKLDSYVSSYVLQLVMSDIEPNLLRVIYENVA